MKLVKNTFSLSFMASGVMCFFTFHRVVDTQDTVFFLSLEFMKILLIDFIDFLCDCG